MEFVSDNQFKVWLPDHTEHVLSLPLPKQVVFPSVLTFRAQPNAQLRS